MTQSIIIGLNETGRNLALLLAVATKQKIILVDTNAVRKEDIKLGYSQADVGYLRTDAVAGAIEDAISGAKARTVSINQSINEAKSVLTDLISNGTQTIVFFCEGTKSTCTYLHNLIGSECADFVVSIITDDGASLVSCVKGLPPDSRLFTFGEPLKAKTAAMSQTLSVQALQTALSWSNLPSLQT